MYAHISLSVFLFLHRMLDGDNAFCHSHLLHQQMTEDLLNSTPVSLEGSSPHPVTTSYTVAVPSSVRLRCRRVEVVHTTPGDYSCQSMTLKDKLLSASIVGDPVAKLKEVMYDLHQCRDRDQANTLKAVYNGLEGEGDPGRSLACLACYHAYPRFLKRYVVTCKLVVVRSVLLLSDVFLRLSAPAKSIKMGRAPVLDDLSYQFVPKNQYLSKISSLLTPYSQMKNMEQLINGELDISEEQRERCSFSSCTFDVSLSCCSRNCSFRLHQTWFEQEHPIHPATEKQDLSLWQASTVN